MSNTATLLLGLAFVAGAIGGKSFLFDILPLQDSSQVDIGL